MNRLKEVALKFACKYLLAPKPVVAIMPDVLCIDCEKSDITRILDTSNNILRIRIDDRHVYFRECKRHTEIHQYVANEIGYYYTQMHPELSEDRRHIEKVLADEKNFTKFINMGITNDSSAGAYHFCMGHGAEYIGLDGMPLAMEERVKDFVQYIWGELFSYRLNQGLKNGCYQTYNATRGIATYRIATLLGLGELIPKTEYAKIFVDGESVCFGTIMDEAPGFSVEKMEESYRKEISSPELQRLLNNLNILDVLCLEKDHRPGNYNVTVSCGKVDNVIAFDNDSPNSFGIGDISFETYIGCSPWSANGKMNRPYVDINTVNRIFEISDNDLDSAICDLLNLYQRVTLKNRFHKIKKILNKVPDEKIITKDMWSEDTIKEELSGAYGKTYLTKFIEKREMPYQPWLKHN